MDVKYNHVLIDRNGNCGRAYPNGAGEWCLENGKSTHSDACLFIAKLKDDGTVDMDRFSVSSDLREKLTT